MTTEIMIRKLKQLMDDAEVLTIVSGRSNSRLGHWDNYIEGATHHLRSAVDRIEKAISLYEEIKGN